MHNKFCVIDYNTVITGSYNWSYKAESNFENIIINSNDTILAEQFIAEFNQIKNQYFPQEPKVESIFPLDKIIRRLEILKNYILLEDIEALRKESNKLSIFSFNSEIVEILTEIEKKEFANAIIKIQKFVSQNQLLTLWIDLEISGLKLEIKTLENQLNAFDNERIELEKLLFDFNHRHALELGELILKILELRKEKFKNNKQKYEDAEKDYKQYHQQFSSEKNTHQFELTNEEKTELKKRFRKATFLCHPDKVNDEFEEAANKIFIELRAAYEANDLNTVTDILYNLEKGIYFKSKSDTLLEKDKLKSAILKLKTQIKTLEIEINTIKENETYKIINSISNLDEYFIKTKESLLFELDDLKRQLNYK
ncbi:MAG: phospholipase D-like domain-containing protein [Bacteroidota bacterium]